MRCVDGDDVVGGGGAGEDGAGGRGEEAVDRVSKIGIIVAGIGRRWEKIRQRFSPVMGPTASD
jgi:hypothetical protein